MRITYFLDWTGSPESGVPMKVIDQISEWRRQSHKVDFIVLAPGRYKTYWEAKGARTISCDSKMQRVYTRLIISPLYLLKSKSEIFYFRYGIFSPLELLAIKMRFTVLEINAENDSYFRLRSKFVNIAYKLQKCYLERFAKAFIHVTLDSYNRSQIKEKSKFVTNGIDLQRFTVLQNDTTVSDDVSAIFLTSADFGWNGNKRLELMATKLDDLTIYAVGINSIKSQQIVQVGEKYGSDLEKFVNRMHLGISTLDIHRMGIDEAAPLKTRQYLASGLPVIAGCKDSAFQTEVPFYFHVKFNSDDTEITNIEELKDFVFGWRHKKVQHEMLHNIDIRNTETDRLRFINKIFAG